MNPCFLTNSTMSWTVAIFSISSSGIDNVFSGVENSFSDPSLAVNVIFKHPEEYRESVGGAETFEELFSRTGEFLDEVVKPLMEQKKNVLIVGHGAMNLSIIGRVNDLPIKDFWTPGIENCKMMKLSDTWK